MSESPFEMRFDPQTIKHLGVRMYSTISPALAEIISNSYDADASRVIVMFEIIDGNTMSITIQDNGMGLSYDDITEKFLVIGRNRRECDGDKPSPKYGRLPIGKKGLGKLALFGLAATITIRTTQNCLRNAFVLDWNDLMKAEGVYKPKAIIVNEKSRNESGTIITLSGLKQKEYDINQIADSLSRIFIFDKDFSLSLKTSYGDTVVVDNKRKYGTFGIVNISSVSKHPKCI